MVLPPQPQLGRQSGPVGVPLKGPSTSAAETEAAARQCRRALSEAVMLLPWRALPLLLGSTPQQRPVDETPERRQYPMSVPWSVGFSVAVPQDSVAVPLPGPVAVPCQASMAVI